MSANGFRPGRDAPVARILDKKKKHSQTDPKPEIECWFCPKSFKQFKDSIEHETNDHQEELAALWRLIGNSNLKPNVVYQKIVIPSSPGGR